MGSHPCLGAAQPRRHDCERHSEDGCSENHTEHTLVDQIHLTMKPLGCPLAPGDFSAEIDIWVSPIIPKFIAHTTTTVVAHDGDEELFCLEVMTTTGDSPWELPEEIMV